MPQNDVIQVMISSRCDDPIRFRDKIRPLSEVRRAIKERIEGLKPFGSELFCCWINEDETSNAGQDTWDWSMRFVKSCDLMIVLYNGHPGWPTSQEKIGICHAELDTGLKSGRAKVYLIRLPLFDGSSLSSQSRGLCLSFQTYVDEQNLPTNTAESGEQVLECIDEVMQEAVVNMFKAGVRESRKGKYDRGPALDWERLTLLERKGEIENTIAETLGANKTAERTATHRFGNQAVLVCYHGVPAAMSTVAAREMVGRPFITDFKLASKMPRTVYGPVHLIGCHKGVTETQAINLLGHPDATVVKTSSGIYLVDSYQKIQLILLANCRDVTSTRNAIQQSLEWLRESGEERYLVKRARARRNIVRAIAKESS